jgi:hypothetical protein
MPPATYPVTLEDAADIIEQLRLSPSKTFVEPSRYRGYLFEDAKTAALLKLRFNAERLPFDNDDQFLMFALADEEIDRWLALCGGEYERVEFVAVQFGSDGDRAQFEAVLSPTN